jgi:hypothetical protein
MKSPTRSPKRPRLPRAGGLLVAALVGPLLALGCDSPNHVKDASPATTHHLSQVSVRLDLPSGGAPAVSVLAFEADASDIAPADVLGAVDPLVAPAPEATCELRDVGGAARTLRAQGGNLNLQELGGVSLLAEGEAPLRPAPRVYPPLAEVVGGVIAEAGPLGLSQAPDSLTLEIPSKSDGNASGDRASVKLALPGTPSLSDSGESPLDGHSALGTKGDLVLRVSGPAKTFLEIRPFGAPSVIACASSASGWVVVPHDLLARLVATAGRAPVSFEAVWRDSRLVQTGTETTRVSFEARSSAVLELRP